MWSFSPTHKNIDKVSRIARADVIMFFVFILLISFGLISTIHGQTCSSRDSCRQLEFRPDHTFDGRRLKNHVIRTVDVMDSDFCERVCYMEPNCVSYNLKKEASDRGNYKCELNNSTFEGQKDKLEGNADYLYRGAENACVNNPCRNDATCQTGFTDKGYRCLCTAGFKGKHCKKDIDECITGKHECSADAVCTNTNGSYNCTCNPGYHGDGIDCKVSPCKEIYDKKKSYESKAYSVKVGNETIDVYCHMATAATGKDWTCGDGGWTMIMKIDGTKSTFHYDSSFWNNSQTLNLAGGKTGFDSEETKLPTYYNTPFSKICLGMKIDTQQKFISITKQANSLYSLIADGQYRATSLGRNSWKTLIGPQASLQANCNKEGFNAVCSNSLASKARIGILGNNEDGCNSCDSRIGFGTGGRDDDSNACGNVACCYGDNGDKHIKAMGYIFVQ